MHSAPCSLLAGTLPRSSAIADDIPELQPLADRVLVEVEDTADVTIGGVVLPDSAKERPLRCVTLVVCGRGGGGQGHSQREGC